ncbi:MAG: hypothetical protein V9G25_09645 [Acidimicrobiia bacterium]
MTKNAPDLQRRAQNIKEARNHCVNKKLLRKRTLVISYGAILEMK